MRFPKPAIHDDVEKIRLDIARDVRVGHNAKVSIGGMRSATLRVIAVGRDGITCEDAKGRTYGFDWIHVQGPTGDDVDDVHEAATEHGEHKPAEHHEPERTDFKKGFDPESFRELDSAIFALEVGPVIAEHLHKAQPAHSDHERFTLLDAHIAAFQKGEYRNRK